MAIDARDWSVIEALQEGFPTVERPYAELAARVDMPEDEFLTRMRSLNDRGIIRRMGVRLRHHRAGVRGNVMVTWCVPEERVDEVGKLLAASDAVSHCYTRPAFDGFPYSLYSMVHASDMDSAEQVVRDLSEQCGISDYLMLRSIRELKKSTPIYRRPEGQ